MGGRARRDPGSRGHECAAGPDRGRARTGGRRYHAGYRARIPPAVPESIGSPRAREGAARQARSGEEPAVSIDYAGETTVWSGGAQVHDRADNVCVIGAGAAGLTSIKNLREYGFGVDCFEREISVGGAWNWRSARSPIYASTHLISSKPFTQYPDFPMPDSWPDYPHHSQVMAYLERYADHFGLREDIWFGTEVTKVEPTGDGRWDVTTSGGGGADRTRRYAAVAIANGHNWSAKMPSYDGLADFRGEVIHASQYKDASQLRGRKVLVVGAGNSGCDIAVEAAQQAARCWHSSRRGYWYAPKYAYGRPSDQVNDFVLG